MSLILKIALLIFPLMAWGKSLNAMAKSATHELQAVGVSVITLGVAWAGYLYIKGGQEGRQKLAEVAVAAVLILGGSAIVAILRRIIGG